MINHELREQIYHSNHRLELLIKHIKNDMRLSNNSKKLLLEYKDRSLAKGVSVNRIMICLRHLRYVSVIIKVDFKKATKKDFETFFAKLYRKKRTEWTIYTYQTVIRAFYRWLYDLEPTEKPPKAVDWIETKRPPNLLQKEDLLTREELESMINATKNVEYKALVSVLFEGGLRPGELMLLERKYITIEEDCIKLKVGGKMERKFGKRTIYLFNSYKLLTDWLNCHPLRKKDNYPIWINADKKVMSMRYLNKIIKNLAEQAGITKRVWPYIFRHSRATELYKHYGSEISKKVLGHSDNSKMASVYCHLNDDDVYEALSGKIKPVGQNIVICPRCKHSNPFASGRCSKCDLCLTMEEASKPKLNEEQVRIIVTNMLKSVGYDVVKLQKVTN